MTNLGHKIISRGHDAFVHLSPVLFYLFSSYKKRGKHDAIDWRSKARRQKNTTSTRKDTVKDRPDPGFSPSPPSFGRVVLGRALIQLRFGSRCADMVW